MLSSHSLAKLGHSVILYFCFFFLAAEKTTIFWSNKYDANESFCCVDVIVACVGFAGGLVIYEGLKMKNKREVQVEVSC